MNLPTRFYINREILGIGLLLISTLSFSFLGNNFINPKWSIIYIIAVFISLLTLYKNEKILFPKATNVLNAILILFLFSFCISLFLWSGLLRSQILDWLCFFVIVLFSYKFFSRDENALEKILRWNSAAAFCVILGAFFQLIGGGTYKFLNFHQYPYSFFGYQNFAAEFIGISIVFLTFSMFISKKSSWLIAVLLFFSFVYLFLLTSGTSLIATSLALASLLLSTKKNIQKLILLTFAAIPICFLVVQIYIPDLAVNSILNKESYKIEDKVFSTNIRINRWLNTINMVRENPFGIGPGKYLVEYPKYSTSYKADTEVSEANWVKSPHNGILELFAEWGLLNGLLVMSIVSLILFRLIIYNPRNLKERNKKQLCLALFVFIAIDMLFAFPLEVPYPFYVVAIFIGLTFSLLFKEHWVIGGIDKNIVLIPLALVILVLSSSFILSSYLLENLEKNPKNLARVCSLWPENISECNN